MQGYLGREADNIIQSDKNLRSFALATGVNASVFRYGNPQDFEDNPEILSKISETSCCQFEMDSSAFCHAVQNKDEGRARCRNFREKASLQCIRLGESYVTRCHAGLTIALAPLLVDERCIGAITCGPVIMWVYDEYAKSEARALAKDLGWDAETLVRAGERLVYKSSDEMGALADMLERIAESLAGVNPGILDKAREINFQQAKIAELLHIKKRTESRLEMLEDSETFSHYPLKKEKELIGLVRIGDRKGAKSLLNEILVDVFYAKESDMDVLKARVLELIVVISRVAVEAGAGLEYMLGLNFEMIAKLSQIFDFKELCIWVSRTLDAMMDTIYKTRNVKNASLLAKAMAFIRDSSDSDITLEDVARHVVVSESHISHLFGQELGISFSAYLIKVRMEKAKQMLSTSDYSIAKISEMVGYDQPGYFSKVFKKHTGLTPGQFRRGDET